MKKLSIIVGLFSVLSIFMMSCGGGQLPVKRRLTYKLELRVNTL